MRTAEEIKMWLEGCDDKSKCSRCLNGYQCERDAYTLAYIQQLEAQMPRWISVEERLPDNGQWVLVYCGGYANWFDLNKWCGANWLKTLPVTHWMPLPEPPKEENRDV